MNPCNPLLILYLENERRRLAALGTRAASHRTLAIAGVPRCPACLRPLTCTALARRPR